LQVKKNVFTVLANENIEKLLFQGAQTTLYCCLEKSIANDSGKYYSDCKEKQPNSRSLIEADQKKLWEISEQMVGLTEPSN